MGRKFRNKALKLRKEKRRRPKNRSENMSKAKNKGYLKIESS